MDQRNFEFLCYGLVAAWAVLMVYVVLLVSREKKIDRDLEALRRLIEKEPVRDAAQRR